jgi:hypothetical protein
MVYRGRFQGLPERGSRGPQGRPREPLKPLSKHHLYRISEVGYGISGPISGAPRARIARPTRTTPRAFETTFQTPFISDIGGRIWYLRGSRARFWRSPRTSRLRGRGQRASFGQARNAFKTQLASGGGVRAAPKPDTRCDWFRRAWNDVVAPPCILHCTPLAPNTGDSQAKCVPDGGCGRGAGFGRPQNQTAGAIGFGVPGMMLRPRRACLGLRTRCIPQRLARSGPKMFQIISKMGSHGRKCVQNEPQGGGQHGTTWRF